MTRKLLLIASALPALAGIALWVLRVDLGLLGTLLASYTVVFLLGLGLWLATLALRRFLWRVSRRLAFSYFLIGIVPIPLVLTLILVAGYISSGFLLSHLYRDALGSLTADLRMTARHHLGKLLDGDLETGAETLPIAFAYYRGREKLAGSTLAPETWQDWWPTEALGDPPKSADRAPLVAGTGGEPTLAAAVTAGDYGVLALYDGDLDRELAGRSGIWLEHVRAGDPRDEAAIKFSVRGREYPLRLPQFGASSAELDTFFHPGIDDPSLLDRPLLTWLELTDPLYDPVTGEVASPYVAVTLTASARTVLEHLASPSSGVGVFAYLVFIGVTFLLFDIYIAAALMALLMIFGLSRAVNRLTDATERVQRGDFSARIEVRRVDQIGALQATFNEMAANLQNLVQTAAQKEILEKELSIARELQQSLLPDTLQAPAELRFATHFEPSAAIGGDYYDLLPMAERKLAVVVADVSGHGISAGLRMAMVKSALQLLCEEEERPEVILRRLHRLLRERLHGSSNGRGFVTATLALIDGERGELVVTNAGHPPTYLLRGGEVREIALPSPPLGSALDGRYGQTTIALVPGDVVVWLSDGLIEAGDREQEVFGYDRLAGALAGLRPDPEAVRDRLLAAIAEHTGGLAPDDDRTLVVMAYRPETPAGDAAGAPASATTVASASGSPSPRKR